MSFPSTKESAFLNDVTFDIQGILEIGVGFITDMDKVYKETKRKPSGNIVITYCEIFDIMVVVGDFKEFIANHGLFLNYFNFIDEGDRNINKLLVGQFTDLFVIPS
jgi:hypothetical protein